MIKHQTYTLVYHDDGPAGACGQSMSTTCPWNKVYLFDSEDEMMAYAKENFATLPRRKRPELSACYPSGDINFSHNQQVIWPNK